MIVSPVGFRSVETMERPASTLHLPTAFDDPLLRTTVDPDAQGEPRYVSIGRDALGIVLVVVWTERDDVIRLISARKPARARRND